ncbi:MAG: hypothetical protein L7U87_05895 [Chlamydiales bacterium]|nr:hypothetical protein [Chlamydiales bacterium]
MEGADALVAKTVLYKRSVKASGNTREEKAGNFTCAQNACRFLSLGSCIVLGVDCVLKVPPLLRYSSLTILVLRALGYLVDTYSNSVSDKDFTNAQLYYEKLSLSRDSMTPKEQEIAGKITEFYGLTGELEKSSHQSALDFNRFVNDELSEIWPEATSALGFSRGAKGLQFFFHGQGASEAFVHTVLELVLGQRVNIAFLDLSHTKMLNGELLSKQLKGKGIASMNLSYCSNFDPMLLFPLVDVCYSLRYLDIHGIEVSQEKIARLKKRLLLIVDGTDVPKMSFKLEEKIEAFLEELKEGDLSQEELVDSFFHRTDNEYKGLLGLVSRFSIRDKEFISSLGARAILKNLNFYCKNIKALVFKNVPQIDLKFFQQLGLSPLSVKSLKVEGCPLFDKPSLVEVLAISSLGEIHINSCKKISAEEAREVMLAHRLRDCLSSRLRVFVDGSEVQLGHLV